MTYTTKAQKLATLLLLTSSTLAVTLKRDSYSSENALAQLDETAQLLTPCLCFEYDDRAALDLINGPWDINIGGKVHAAVNNKCENYAVLDDLTPPDLTGEFKHVVPVTNQSCLYKLWMCKCWASQTDGCLCAKENPDNTVTFIAPKMGGCEAGSGPLTNPMANEAGGEALQCSPNPCLACCACGKEVCTGDGNPLDDDDQSMSGRDCCDCCGPRGGYPCGLGGRCEGSGDGGSGNGMNGGGGDNNGYRGGGGGGVSVKQNVNTDGC